MRESLHSTQQAAQAHATAEEGVRRELEASELNRQAQQAEHARVQHRLDEVQQQLDTAKAVQHAGKQQLLAAEDSAVEAQREAQRLRSMLSTRDDRVAELAKVVEAEKSQRLQAEAKRDQLRDLLQSQQAHCHLCLALANHRCKRMRGDTKRALHQTRLTPRYKGAALMSMTIPVSADSGRGGTGPAA